MDAVRFVRVAVILPLVLIAGCAATGPVLSASGQGGIPTRVDLEQTPFFPQVEYQCGPAALATVLSASGLPVVPADLVPEVYLPGRRGSLQPELLASARRRDRLPYELPPTSDAIVSQLAAGIPVLVLQKLGAGPWPGWHYAVVIGYDVEEQVFLLRSGTERRLEMPAARFLATWDRADRWAIVVLQPGQMPGAPDAGRYVEAAAALEAVGHIDAARRRVPGCGNTVASGTRCPGWRSAMWRSHVVTSPRPRVITDRPSSSTGGTSPPTTTLPRSCCVAAA